MYHQCDSEPYDVEADGGFGQPIDVEAVGITPESAANVWTGIFAALLFVLMAVGAPILFFHDAVLLGWLCLLGGSAGLVRIWTVSIRR